MKDTYRGGVMTTSDVVVLGVRDIRDVEGFHGVPASCRSVLYIAAQDWNVEGRPAIAKNIRRMERCTHNTPCTINYSR